MAVDAVWPLDCAIAAGSEAGTRVVVLDGYPPGKGLRAMADVTSSQPDLGVLVLGPLEPFVDVLIALASGAFGYLPAASDPSVIADAVCTLLVGDTVLPRPVSLPLVQHLRPGGRGIVVADPNGRETELTNREWEVLVLLSQAHTTAEMASYLVVSKGTIRTHVSALIHKLGVDDRHQLAARWAGDHGRQTGDRTASNTVGNSSPRTAAKSIGAHHPAAAVVAGRASAANCPTSAHSSG